MNYYSHVAIECNDKAAMMINEFIKDISLVPDSSYVSTYGSIVFMWDCIEWDDELDEVSGLIKILDELDDKRGEKGYEYHFARAGDDYTDTEERDNAPYGRPSTLDGIFLNACIEVPDKERDYDEEVF